MTWIQRLLRRPRAEDPANKTQAIIDVARDMRGSMLQETKASRHAQREMREMFEERDSNWYEDELLQRLPRAGRNNNA